MIEIETLARSFAPDAMRTLHQRLKSENESACIAAAKVILDRGYGQARQPIDATLKDERMVVEAPRPAKDAETWVGEHGPH